VIFSPRSANDRGPTAGSIFPMFRYVHLPTAMAGRSGFEGSAQQEDLYNPN